MRYTLTSYQVKAVDDVLVALKRSGDDWRGPRRELTAFALSAPTGSGKTVIAAAVIEVLLAGNDDYDRESGAVVLWFTDNPDLNAQTRSRLQEAAERIDSTQLRIVNDGFVGDRLEAGNVYFLNSQKLGRNSNLAKHTDGRQHTMCDVLKNTIEDRSLTLYVILDEAHRGMRQSNGAERQTIVRRLVNGHNNVPPVPVVWGISATIKRFRTAMEDAEGRVSRPSIEIPVEDVQESGLLKDALRLDFPSEEGDFGEVLLRRAAQKAQDATARWREYGRRTPSAPEVKPLLVVQVENKVSEETLLRYFTVVRDAWNDRSLRKDDFAHAFGEHTTIALGGGVEVPYIAPQRVQDSYIRVLFAKEAISIGWDCPRAEVLMSFRPARDRTHIEQLLGRMVRTPLARRIPFNEQLNSVECVLPYFTMREANRVADQLRSGVDGEENADRRVLMAPEDMSVNPAVPGDVWDTFDRLPTQTLPRPVKPAQRLKRLSLALGHDEILVGASAAAEDRLFRVLDGLRATHRPAIDEAKKEIYRVEGSTLTVNLRQRGAKTADAEFEEVADDRSVEAIFRATAYRAMSAGVARSYVRRLAGDDGDELDAYVEVAALGRQDGVADALDGAANEQYNEWWSCYEDRIGMLDDHRRSEYDEIHSTAAEPQRIRIRRPEEVSEPTRRRDDSEISLWKSHLMCNPAGDYPADLNDWERDVLETEMGHQGFEFWYRNRARSGCGLAIAYKAEGKWRRMYPDFIFFFRNAEGQVRVSIIDPHDPTRGDAVPKLRGLADYAATYSDEFHQIRSAAMRERQESLCVLDLKNAEIREAIGRAKEAQTLYRTLGTPYR